MKSKKAGPEGACLYSLGCLPCPELVCPSLEKRNDLKDTTGMRCGFLGSSNSFGLKTETFRAGKMAQWMRVLTTKPGNLSSIPRTHMVEGENRLLQVVLWSSHTYRSKLTITHTHTHTHTHTQINKCNKNSYVLTKCKEGRNKFLLSPKACPKQKFFETLFHISQVGLELGMYDLEFLSLPSLFPKC